MRAGRVNVDFAHGGNQDPHRAASAARVLPRLAGQLEGEVISIASPGAKGWMGAPDRGVKFGGEISAMSGARTVSAARRNHCSEMTVPWLL